MSRIGNRIIMIPEGVTVDDIYECIGCQYIH